MDSSADELIARLRRNPDDGAAFAALRAHYQRVGDYASLVNLLEGYGARVADASLAARAFFDAAELAWGALGDAGRGAALYERALERDPAHDDSFARLLAIYEQAGDAQRVATLYERRAEGLGARGGDPRAVAALHHRLGELWEHTFRRADRAIVHYRKAFELDPTLVPAIYAAREIYRQAGNTKAVATLLELEAKAEPDEERKVALLRELARLRADSLGDPEGAIVALKRALGHAPSHPDLLEGLAALYLERAARQPDPQIAETDRRRASDLFFQLAQRLPPTDAVPLLERALDTTPDHDGALSLLERIADRVGHFELLPRRWVAFLGRAPDGPSARERRARLARAYLDAGQIEYAITCLEWIADEGEPEAVQQLVELYRRVGRDEDAVRLLSRAGAALPVPLRVTHMRAAMETARARGDDDGAADLARRILEADPADPEATAFLEDRHRRRGEWSALRDLLLAAARVPGLSVEARKQRFREVAQICERRLGDGEGAVQAWRQVVTLDVADREARLSLVRILEHLERWDELAQALEREAVASPEPSVKLAAYKQLARVHAVHRRDSAEATLAWRAALDVAPDDAEAREGWIAGLLAAGALAQAVAPMRERARAAAPGSERAEAMRALARTLDQLANGPVETSSGASPDARAHEAVEAWTRVLDDAPRDLEALERLEALDRRIGDWERLVRTLSYRADIEEPSQRLAVLVRMGEVIEHAIGDLPRAAEVYRRAFELDPRNEAVVDALTRVYERTERYREIVAILNDRAHVEDEPSRRAALYRRIARLLAERVGNAEGAAEAYAKVLESGEDREALAFLAERAEHRGAFDEAEQLLGRLADAAESEAERRDRMVRRADLLADALGRRAEAIAILRHVVSDVDPTHLPSLGKLGDLAEEAGDVALLAETLERTLRVVDDPSLRVPIAERLARIHLTDLPDPGRAIEALSRWHEASPFDEEPLRLLVPILEREGRHRELVVALDALAELQRDETIASEFVRRAAAVCVNHLGDFDAALARLATHVRQGDRAAQRDLYELARRAARGEAMVALLSEIAQAAEQPEEQKERWREAAQAAELLCDDPARALELVLKALAVDLADLSVLDEADRLAAVSRQYSRLQQVYDALLRRTESRADKVELLLRHAAVLRRDAEERGNAVDRLLRAASLAPFDARVLGALEELAPEVGRAEDLLLVYDRRKKEAQDDAARVHELLAAARVAERHLDDRERAVAFLAQATALAVRTPSLFEVLERGASEVSAELGRALVDVYGALAEDLDADARNAAALLVRASRLLRMPPADDDGAYGALLRAATLAPFDVSTLQALEDLAAELGRLPALAVQLGKLVEDALDAKSASALLDRRARVLERLERFDEAAECWVRLRQLQPNDVEVRMRIRAALRRAKKFDDLLVALENDLRAFKDPAFQIATRREIARTWERDLRNRWEALDAWQRVVKLASDDAEALEAVARLGQGGSGLLRTSDDVLPGSGELRPRASEGADRSADLAHAGLAGVGLADAGFEDADALDSKPKDLDASGAAARFASGMDVARSPSISDDLLTHDDVEAVDDDDVSASLEPHAVAFVREEALSEGRESDEGARDGAWGSTGTPVFEGFAPATSDGTGEVDLLDLEPAMDGDDDRFAVDVGAAPRGASHDTGALDIGDLEPIEGPPDGREVAARGVEEPFEVDASQLREDEAEEPFEVDASQLREDGAGESVVSLDALDALVRSDDDPPPAERLVGDGGDEPEELDADEIEEELEPAGEVARPDPPPPPSPARGASLPPRPPPPRRDEDR